MKLSIQTQAFVNLLVKILIAFAAVFAIAGLVAVVPLDMLLGYASVLLMLFCIYNLYQIELMQLKSKQDKEIDAK
jgi:uncharacterized membrane protein